MKKEYSKKKGEIKKRLAEFARTEQDLQRKINSLNELLLNISQSGASASAQDKIRSDISSLRSERNSVKKDIENRENRVWLQTPPNRVDVVKKCDYIIV